MSRISQIRASIAQIETYLHFFENQGTQAPDIGKAGSQAHVDAVMGVVRRTIVTELQKTIDSLKGCLIDIAFDAEQESK